MELLLGNNKDDGVKVVVITGACRSGKTTLSKLIASMEGVEWIEEPYALLKIPVLEYFGLIDRNTAISFIRANIKELFNDNILLRNGNFRLSDLSSTWNVKSPGEIFERLNVLKTRDDVRAYINKNNNMILIDMPEIHPFIEVLYESFANIKVIHVVRNGLRVAKEIELKQWFSDNQLLEPKNNSLYYKYSRSESDKEYFLPWWVRQEDAYSFINYSEHSKGLYYWYRMMGYNEFYKREKSLSNYRIIRYEDLVLEPKSMVDDLAYFLGAKKTHISNDLLDRIYRNETISPTNDYTDIKKDILIEIEAIMENYGYKL